MATCPTLSAVARNFPSGETSTLDSAVSLFPTSQLHAEDERRAVTRLQLFMGTRLGVATLLLGGTLLIALEDRRGFDSFTPQFLVSLIAVIFGVRWIAMLFGFAFFSDQVGGFLGVWLGGLVFEYSGSYNPVWWLSVLFGVLSALINLPIVEKPAPRLAAAAA